MTDCKDCPDGETHSTESLVRCRYVVGWRDINSKCVLKKGLGKVGTEV